MFVKLDRNGAGRDLVKTASFGALHFAVGFGVSYAFTGSIVLAGGIALVEPLINTLVFYVHERAWNRVGTGHVRRSRVPAQHAQQTP